MAPLSFVKYKYKFVILNGSFYYQLICKSTVLGEVPHNEQYLAPRTSRFAFMLLRTSSWGFIEALKRLNARANAPAMRHFFVADWLAITGGSFGAVSCIDPKVTLCQTQTPIDTLSGPSIEIICTDLTRPFDNGKSSRTMSAICLAIQDRE